MIRRLLPFALLIALVAVAAPAYGATPDDAAAGLSSNGYYVEPGSESVSVARLGDLVQTMGNQGYRFLPVVLATDPTAGATAFGDGILDVLGSGTVLVVSPGEVGWTSTEIDPTTLDGAGQAALEQSTADGIFSTFVADLVPGAVTVPTTTPQQEPAASGGGGFPWVLVFVVGGLVLLTVMLVRGSGKREKVRREQDIDEARAEIKAQLDAVANEILEDSDAVRVSDSAEAREYFETASATYADAMEQFEKTTNLADLEKIADRLDEARWQLQASDALRAGRPVPPKPEPKQRGATCFFDPTHKRATEEATLRTDAGDKKVMVCSDCAAKLRRGEQPDTRMIEVGGRKVPAPMAPRSYGGGGFDWMGAFTILIGGMMRGGGWGRMAGGRGFPAPRARASRRETGYSVPRLPTFGRPGGGRSGGGGGTRSGGGGGRARGGGSRRR